MTKYIRKNLKKISFITKTYHYLNKLYTIYFVYSLNSFINYEKISRYYLGTSDTIVAEAIRALSKNKRMMIPFEYTKKIKNQKYEIFNLASDYPGVLINGKQIYFPINTKKKQIAEAMQVHFIEQDPESPHRYILDKSKISGHTAILIGASDGIFALEIMDYYKHIFLFESDINWIEPLTRTLEQYKNKITIVNKYVSDKLSDTETTLDSYFYDYKYSIDFLQADVEGAAYELLKGGREILEKNNIKLAIACYHYHNEAELIGEILQVMGYKVTFSKRFVYMWMQKLKEPYFRKGILFGDKDHNMIFKHTN